MKRLENIDRIMKILGEEAAMQDFDKVRNLDEHIFSKEYIEKKGLLLERAKSENKKRRWRYMYAAAAAAALIIIPTTVYAAQKVYSTFFSKNGYELNYSVIKDDTEEGTERSETTALSSGKLTPVKLTLDYLPEGFLQDEEMKYSYENNCKGGFSFRLWGVEDDTTYKFPYAVDYKDINVNANKGIIITKPGDWSFNKELIIFFEDKGYVVECYVGNDVSEEELMKVAQGITLKDVPVEEATAYEIYAPVETEVAEETSPLPIDNVKIYNVGDVIDYNSLYGEELEQGSFNFKIENVEVFDSISGFDITDFLDYGIEGRVDENGMLTAYDREKIKYGDGVNTLDEVISVKTVNRKFLYLTVIMENKEDYPVEDVFVTPTLQFLKEVNKELVPNDENYEYDGYPIYLTPHGEEKAYYKIDLEAGEKAVLHIGYIVDEDFLESAFINVDSASGDSDDMRLIDVRQ